MEESQQNLGQATQSCLSFWRQHSAGDNQTANGGNGVANGGNNATTGRNNATKSANNNANNNTAAAEGAAAAVVETDLEGESEASGRTVVNAFLTFVLLTPTAARTETRTP